MKQNGKKQNPVFLPELTTILELKEDLASSYIFHEAVPSPPALQIAS